MDASTLALAAVALFALNKFGKVNAIDSMKFLIHDVYVEKFIVSPTLDIEVLIQNPTNESFTVKAFVAEAFINGDYIGNVSGFQETVIKPNEEVETILKVRFGLGDIIDQVVGILDGSNGLEAVVRVKGKVNVDNLLIPLDMQMKII